MLTKTIYSKHGNLLTYLNPQWPVHVHTLDLMGLFSAVAATIIKRGSVKKSQSG
jgi:hypothetical protein